MCANVKLPEIKKKKKGSVVPAFVSSKCIMDQDKGEVSRWSVSSVCVCVEEIQNCCLSSTPVFFLTNKVRDLIA